jgi:hypothetical protein
VATAATAATAIGEDDNGAANDVPDTRLAVGITVAGTAVASTVAGTVLEVVMGIPSAPVEVVVAVAENAIEGALA